MDGLVDGHGVAGAVAVDVSVGWDQNARPRLSSPASRFTKPPGEWHLREARGGRPSGAVPSPSAAEIHIPRCAFLLTEHAPVREAAAEAHGMR